MAKRFVNMKKPALAILILIQFIILLLFAITMVITNNVKFKTQYYFGLLMKDVLVFFVLTALFIANVLATNKGIRYISISLSIIYIVLIIPLFLYYLYTPQSSVTKNQSNYLIVDKAAYHYLDDKNINILNTEKDKIQIIDYEYYWEPMPKFLRIKSLVKYNTHEDFEQELNRLQKEPFAVESENKYLVKVNTNDTVFYQIDFDSDSIFYYVECVGDNLCVRKSTAQLC